MNMSITYQAVHTPTRSTRTNAAPHSDSPFPYTLRMSKTCSHQNKGSSRGQGEMTQMTILNLCHILQNRVHVQRLTFMLAGPAANVVANGLETLSENCEHTKWNNRPNVQPLCHRGAATFCQGGRIWQCQLTMITVSMSSAIPGRNSSAEAKESVVQFRVHAEPNISATVCCAVASPGESEAAGAAAAQRMSTADSSCMAPHCSCGPRSKYA